MLPRFFLSPIPIINGQVVIQDLALIHQLTNVLRLTKNDIFVVFSPQEEYKLVIKEIGNKTISCEILEKNESPREPAKKLTLYQSLLKKDKFEWILQKGVELGVSAFVPVISDNSIIRGISANKWQRYQKIIKEATEQCGGQSPAVLDQPVTFPESLEKIKNAGGQKIIAWEGQHGNNLASIIKPNLPHYHLFIGPEGGYSPAEIEIAEQNGLTAVSLGTRILRAETAAIAACSLILLS